MSSARLPLSLAVIVIAAIACGPAASPPEPAATEPESSAPAAASPTPEAQFTAPGTVNRGHRGGAQFIAPGQWSARTRRDSLRRTPPLPSLAPGTVGGAKGREGMGVG